MKFIYIYIYREREREKEKIRNISFWGRIEYVGVIIEVIGMY